MLPKRNLRGPYMKNHRQCWIENNLCNIPLKSGEIAICDEDRFDEVAKYNWYKKDVRWHYPCTRIEGKTTTLHKLLYPELTMVDHINSNPFDNRSCNLREATVIENSHNSTKPRHNKSGYKGVSVIRGKWQVTIQGNYIGIYSDLVVAAHVYDEHAKKLYGDFAKLNFPNS